MLKYRGQYRVTYEMDSKKKPCEFTMIPCTLKKGVNICRHNRNTLNVYIPSAIIIKRLLQKYPELFTAFQLGDAEGTVLFDEKDMPKASKILKARTKGKNVSPRAKRNAVLLQKA